MDGVFSDLALAWRNLRRASRGSLAAIFLLALGIGAVTLLFEPLSTLVLAPLPFPHSDRLVYVGDAPIFSVYSARFPHRHALAPIFSGIAAYWPTTEALWAGSRPTEVAAATVTPEFFATLGVFPRLGRRLGGGADRAGAMIVSDGLWRDRLHGARDLSRLSVSLNGIHYSVAGVMPPGFDFPGGAQVWRLAPRNGGAPGPESGLVVFGRLQPGLTVGAAAVRLKTVASYTPNIGLVSARGPVLERLHTYLLGNRRPLLWSLWGASLLFLLLACAGVGNLVLAGGVRRRAEVALRLALGADRWRVSRQLLLETFLLAAAGGGLGLLLAIPSGRWLQTVLPAGLAATPALSSTVIGLVVALVLTTTVVCGMLPAWHAVQADLTAYLKPSGTPRGAAAPRRWGFTVGELLPTAQLVLALALLVAGGLLLRSLISRLALNLGFQPHDVVLVRSAITPLPATTAAYASWTGPWTKAIGAKVGAAYRREAARDEPLAAQARRELAALPEVLAVGDLEPAPFGPRTNTPVTIFATLRINDSSPYTLAYLRSVRGNAFQILGMRLLAGRFFSAGDLAGVAEAKALSMQTGRWPDDRFMPVVVNERLARLYWPGQNPLGKEFSGLLPSRVVGVVSNIHESGARLDILPTVYQPTPLSLHFMVRLRPGASLATFATAADRIFSQLGPAITRPKVTSLREQVAQAWASLRLALLLLACFAVLGIIVAGLGVYASAAHMAAACVPEMGIRVALGARAGQIRGLALWRSARMALVALPLGSLGAWLLARGLSHWLFRVGTADPLSYVAGSALLVCVALIAALRPALRLAKTDPAAALREL